MDSANDKDAYARVMELLASNRMRNENDEIETIPRSTDDVEYMEIEFPPEPLAIASTASTLAATSAAENSNNRHNLKEDIAPLKLSTGLTNKPSKQSSVAWKFFTKIDISSARCNICHNVFKHAGNTTNLIQHITKKHPTFFTPVPKKTVAVEKGHAIIGSCENSEDVDDPTCSTENTSSNPMNRKRPRNESMEKIVSKPVRIDHAFQKACSFADGGSTADKITNSILYMIATDQVPLSIVENEGFLVLMKNAAPLYHVPSRRTITRLVHLKYELLKKAFQESLQNVPSYTLTCDNWTDVSNQSYLGVTIRWLSSDHVLESGCLGVLPLHESHTALYLAETLLTVLQSFALNSDNVTAVVTDRAANIKKAVSDTFGASKWLPCFAHIISSVVPTVIASMPDIKKIITKVKNIVILTKRSVVASDKLKRLQIRDGKSESTALKFIQDVPTRWNSTLYMLDRFFTLEEYAYPVTLKCKSIPDMLTRDEIIILRDIVSLLQPIENVITQISGSLYPTCSIIIPIVHCMLVAIENWNPETSNGGNTATKIGIELEEKLLSTIALGFKDRESNPILAISTILDPRFKKIHFRSALAASSAINKINALIKPTTTSEKSSAASCPEDRPNAQSKRKDVWYVHDDLVTKSAASTTNQTESLCLELRQFLSQPVIPRTEDPFQHWKTLKLAYPALYKVAIKYLSVVGTSVASERLFSKAGAIKVENRSRLSGDLLNELLFLASVSQKLWGL